MNRKAANWAGPGLARSWCFPIGSLLSFGIRRLSGWRLNKVGDREVTLYRRDIVPPRPLVQGQYKGNAPLEAVVCADAGRSATGQTRLEAALSSRSKRDLAQKRDAFLLITPDSGLKSNRKACHALIQIKQPDLMSHQAGSDGLHSEWPRSRRPRTCSGQPGLAS